MNAGILFLFIAGLFHAGPERNLEGLWQVSLDGQRWQSVKVPGNLHELFGPLEHPSHRIILKRRILASPDFTGWRTGFLSDAARFYIDGKPLNAETVFDTDAPDSYDRNRVLRLPGSTGNTLELKIHLRPYFEHEYGLLNGSPAIGRFEELQRSFALEQLTVLLLPSIFLILSLYYTCVFLLFRNQYSSLSLSIFLSLLAFYLLHRSELKYEMGLDLLNLKRLEYVALMLLLPSLLLFFQTLFRRNPRLPARWNRLFRRTEVVVGISCSLSLLLSTLWILFSDDLRAWDRWNTVVVQVALWPPLLALMILRLALHWKMGRSLLIGSGIALIGTLIDISTHQGLIQLPSVAPISLLAFVGGLALTEVDASIQTGRQLAQLNRELERRVEQRTDRYRKSLHEIRSLKEQQDGDYFLTSLVLQPLSCRNSSGGNRRLRWSSITKQKKHFEFKERRGELGGDINIVSTVRLRSREYIAFLNADAMGKSIQGAGGAVVIGTVMGACINRTERHPELSALYPEEWLRRCYEELQAVFCSFNGSMMASAVMGLIDVTAGCLYHWNAEHPAIALYRNGESFFIRPPAVLYRLGATLPGQELRIHVLELKEGDHLYAGTDGRDDLLIDGKMDSDPDRFLTFINLFEEIPENRNNLEAFSGFIPFIERQAKFSDDIAVLRFDYHGRCIRSVPIMLKRRAAHLLRERRWSESLPTLENYLELRPADERSLRVGIRVARRLGHPLAERWDRRLRLRDAASE